MQLFDLTGKTAIVIGGSSTLGGAMAEALAAHGANVAITARSADRAEGVLSRIAQAGGQARAFEVEATSKSDLEQLLQGVLDWTGSADILLHCPGRNSATPFFDITEEEWDGIMDVNAKSVMLASQVFGKQMIAQGSGSIIHISSVSSGPALSRVFTYSASKAAVNNMTQFLAREFAGSNVRVNAIIPGFFPAEQNRAILSEERVASILGHTPMNRFGSPEELQGAVIYLASERASGYVTGSLLRVDGGFGAMTI
ncbi:SDR family oxidoreductase [Paenibacillaceae bacterium]|nr:SDR family oxidoreductase [Paenibacillaceae bacterium]